MYPNNNNILQLLSLVVSNDINEVVISPGARNAPIIHAFANCPNISCHRVVDERSAAFYAMGIAEATNRPVVLCCTSGSAVLNYAPAIAEAYLRRIPLIIITADRPQSQIGQMDGQTIHQVGAFNSITSKSISLPEGNDKASRLYANRLINEAFIALGEKESQPVHINIPIDEPLFDFTIESLPIARKVIRSSYDISASANSLKEQWTRAKKKIIIVGQNKPDKALTEELKEIVKKHDCIVISELISNLPNELSISNFDLIVRSTTEEQRMRLYPDLVITIGGHIVSRELKRWLQNGETEHWHISPFDELPDIFFNITTSVRTDVTPFIKQLSNFETKNREQSADYKELWQTLHNSIESPICNKYSREVLNDLYVTGRIATTIDNSTSLHIANSSSIRNVQLFRPNAKAYYCNRGVSGIEGSLSTAIGHSTTSIGTHLLIIGDLSFFYDMNALSIDNIPPRFKVILINNGGGSLFHQIKGLNSSNSLNKFVAHHHNLTAKSWVESCGWEYFSATEKDEFEENLHLFMSETKDKPSFFEVFTDIDETTKAISQYILSVKQIIDQI